MSNRTPQVHVNVITYHDLPIFCNARVMLLHIYYMTYDIKFSQMGRTTLSMMETTNSDLLSSNGSCDT